MAGSVNLERALYLRERHRWCVEDEAVDTGPAGCLGNARLRETDAPVGKLEPPVYSAGDSSMGPHTGTCRCRRRLVGYKRVARHQDEQCPPGRADSDSREQAIGGQGDVEWRFSPMWRPRCGCGLVDVPPCFGGSGDQVDGPHALALDVTQYCRQPLTNEDRLLWMNVSNT